MMREKTQLYLITPPIFEPVRFAETLREAFDAGEVGALQIRLKDADYVALPDDTQRQALEQIQPICAEYGVTCILNDLPHLAKEYQLDGVHLGMDDTPIAEARALLGDEMIIGASCYGSKERAFEAGAAGADYVAFGQFYTTDTKPPKGRPGLDILEDWQASSELPCVAIGGIKVENCRPLIEAGADFLAVVTGVWNHPDDPAAAVKAFNRVIDACF